MASTAYKGITVTLTTHNVRQNVMDLLQAAVSAVEFATIPKGCRELNIQFDSTQHGLLFYGDSAVSTPGMGAQRCGGTLQPGDTKTYGAGASTREVYLGFISLVADTDDAAKVNIEIQN